MKAKINNLLPYTNVEKSWLTNLSVASFAVGLYEQNGIGVVCGTVLIACALWIVRLEMGVEK